MVTVQVAGDYAMFAQPAFGKEKHSYPLITPAAAEGMLQSIYWKPQFCYEIKRIEIVNPGRMQSMTFNDKNLTGEAMKGGRLVADVALPRSYNLLRDVEYRIHAHISIPEGTSLREGQNVWSFVNQFQERVEKGRQYQVPFFGMKEFIANFYPANDAPISHDLDGLVLSLPLRTRHEDRQRKSPIIGFSWVQVAVANGSYIVDESKAIHVNTRGEVV